MALNDESVMRRPSGFLLCQRRFRPALTSLAAALFFPWWLLSLQAGPAKFVVAQPGSGTVTSEVVWFTERKDVSEAANLDELLKKTSQIQDKYIQPDPAVEALRYLREAVRRMTGKELTLTGRHDASKGIVLMTLDEAPPEIRHDPKVQEALKNTGKDAYNANEAFYVRTEPERVLIVTNTVQGFNHAVVELMESAGYEVLGMGPNWTYVPDYTSKPLVLELEKAGRPGFYLRDIGPMAGQGHGIGTLFNRKLPDPADETVETSYNRWSIGTHIVGKSMDRFPGHAMQEYHRRVFAKMNELGTDEGFMSPPAPEIVFREGKYFLKDEEERSLKLDLSTSLVRDIVLADFKEKSEKHFATDGTTPFVFATEPEDGIVEEDVQKMRHPDWYPEYLRKEGVAFGQPYALDGFNGLKQPREIWEPFGFADTVFGFNNWLLREYDKWIDSLPAAEQVTSAGIPKKQLVRTSLYSYNVHDVPPNFNLDPRIRVMIAGFPVHRGFGKWKCTATSLDMARAFRLLLPREVSGDYWINSISYYRDYDTNGIRGSRSPETIRKRVRDEYDAGIRAIFMEADFNFGKMGLEYYLYAKLLWNPLLTPEEINTLRTSWLKRAFGSGWEEMGKYYDFMAPENNSVNVPNSWAKALRLIEAADRKINRQTESAAALRLDDLKQFWYFYYLRESGQASPPSAALREFVWKGQMSYMTAMHMVVSRCFKQSSAIEAAGTGFAQGPAHYSPEETAVWWAKVLDFWKRTPVSEFADTVVANGKPGARIDTNDLVSVAEFRGRSPGVPFAYNSAQRNASFLSTVSHAGEKIGFKLWWPYDPAQRALSARHVSYGISRWNSREKHWEDLVDEATIAVPSNEVRGGDGKPYQVAEVQFQTPQPGTYRINLGHGGDLAYVGDISFKIGVGEDQQASAGSSGFTFFEPLLGNVQGPAYLYIPKGVRHFDVEVWGPTTRKKLIFHNGLPSSGLRPTRTVDISRNGTHTIELAPGEDGSLVAFESQGFVMPYCYSVPLLWAKSPDALLLPREIATADGLRIRP